MQQDMKWCRFNYLGFIVTNNRGCENEIQWPDQQLLSSLKSGIILTKKQTTLAEVLVFPIATYAAEINN